MKSLSSDRMRLVAVIAGLNVVLAIVGWLLLVAPQSHHAAADAHLAKEAQTALVSASGVAGVAQQVKHPPHIPTQMLYGPLAHAMPTSEDEPDLLLQLDHLALATGVRVLGVSPGTPIAGIAYTTIPITLDLGGGYYQLTDFLHHLRELVYLRHGKLVATGRLFAVSAVSVTPGTKRRQETATVSVDAYVYGTVAGVTPAATDTTSTDTSSTSTTTTSGG